jgi:alpha-D-ribose 1-methylphosphonate 5-triphosphate diphosphatase PhnM
VQYGSRASSQAAVATLGARDRASLLPEDMQGVFMMIARAAKKGPARAMHMAHIRCAVHGVY